MPRTRARTLRIPGARPGRVDALWTVPSDPQWCFVLAHGAGAGMRHPFLESAARELARRGAAVLRFQFPYMQAGIRRPDARPLLMRTVAAACRAARQGRPGIPLVAGGKSMGGRMTSLAAAEGLLPGVEGIAFLGFPLHPAGRPGAERAEHLDGVDVPLLFLQGDRDKLADLALLRPVVRKLGRRARLHVLEGADHGFQVLRRSGRSGDAVLEELAETLQAWVRRRFPGR